MLFRLYFQRAGYHEGTSMPAIRRLSWRSLGIVIGRVIRKLILCARIRSGKTFGAAALDTGVIREE
jgi:hypothetical protein